MKVNIICGMNGHEMSLGEICNILGWLLAQSKMSTLTVGTDITVVYDGALKRITIHRRGNDFVYSQDDEKFQDKKIKLWSVEGIIGGDYFDGVCYEPEGCVVVVSPIRASSMN